MSRNILVTGGAGYIGAHACKALAKAGFMPVTYDNLSLGHERFVRWGPLVRGDTRDHAAVACAVREYSIVAVMHFAAFAYVGESVADPAKYYDNNVLGTINLLRGMRDGGCNKLVFSSTCAVYGEADDRPIAETWPTEPVNPYGRSKLMCERVMHDYAFAYGLNYVALRYFNASGADPEVEIGEDREVETHLIPSAILFLLGRNPDFQIFGTNYPTPDGTAVRDFIHVTDLASAHVGALRYVLEPSHAPLTVNLGTGRGYSVGQILNTISRVAGMTMPMPTGERRSGDPASLVANADLARRTIAFNPCHSDIGSIIETAWRWHNRTHRSQT